MSAVVIVRRLYEKFIRKNTVTRNILEFIELFREFLHSELRRTTSKLVKQITTARGITKTTSFDGEVYKLYVCDITNLTHIILALLLNRHPVQFFCWRREIVSLHFHEAAD